MKKLLFNPLAYLMLSLILFTSCKEDEIDSIFFRTDGGISTILKDTDGQAISDVKVSLYNIRTDNRIDVGYTNENGVIDFGRFEAGEYTISTELNHDNEFFQIYEEVHIISGVDTQHEINISDHYGEMLVKILDNSGQPIEFNTGAMIGLIPRDEAFREANTIEKMRELIKYSFEFESEQLITDLPESGYVVVLYNDETIFDSNYASVDPYDKNYINFYINPLSFLLESKTSWVVTNITADSDVDNIMPISRISFKGNNYMDVTFDNGEMDESRYFLNDSGGFDWYSLGTSKYNCIFSEDIYEINSDGSITFHFNYWETYNYNEGIGYSSGNVSITLN